MQTLRLGSFISSLSYKIAVGSQNAIRTPILALTPPSDRSGRKATHLAAQKTPLCPRESLGREIRSAAPCHGRPVEGRLWERGRECCPLPFSIL